MHYLLLLILIWDSAWFKNCPTEPELCPVLC